MAKPLLIFRESSGINTKLDPVRLRFSAENGISELAAAVNVIVDNSGRIIRRDGSTVTSRIESWKNLFGCGAYGIGTMGDALCIIEPNMAYTAIRNITPDTRMSYVRSTDGKQDVIFYANGFQHGRIIEKVSHGWPLIVPVGTKTIKSFYPAPLGHLLEVYNGRMFIAVNNLLCYSEPNTYHAYRLAANYFGFPSRIKMIQAVSGGLWISDSESVYFLGGIIAPSLQEMPVQIKVADYPVIEGSAVKVPGSRIGEGMAGIVVVFTTTEGVCIGTGDGQLINVTERKIDMPEGLSGAGFYKDGQYIVTIK